MQHEAAVGLDRAAEVNQRVFDRADFKRQFDALEQGAQGQVGGPVDDQAQRAAFGVFTHVDDRAGQAALDHAGHGDQELVGKVGRLRCGGFVMFFRHGNPFG
ncbi:hypothetical protein D3C77_679850 [compost metagenome]